MGRPSVDGDGPPVTHLLPETVSQLSSWMGQLSPMSRSGFAGGLWACLIFEPFLFFGVLVFPVPAAMFFF